MQIAKLMDGRSRLRPVGSGENWPATEGAHLSIMQWETPVLSVIVLQFSRSCIYLWSVKAAWTDRLCEISIPVAYRQM